MKKFVVITELLMILATTVVVSAAREYPCGGEWHYGVGATGSFSDYYHDGRDHTATVKHGADYDKGEASKGYWAKARLTRYHGCSFYYNVL